MMGIWAALGAALWLAFSGASSPALIAPSGDGYPVQADQRPVAAPPAPSTYIVVSVPQARLWMVREGKLHGSMRVIVGDPRHPTPVMTSAITHVVLEPHWHVPQDLVRTRLAWAAIRSNGRSLTDGGYEVMSGWGDSAVPVRPDLIDWKAVAAGAVQVAVRQRPGPGNAMGRAKFVMPNDRGIYLHDTPERSLFVANDRARSAGCVRLEDYQAVLDFVAPSLPEMPDDGRPTYVKLAQPVPVYVTHQEPEPTGGELARPVVTSSVDV